LYASSSTGFNAGPSQWCVLWRVDIAAATLSDSLWHAEANKFFVHSDKIKKSPFLSPSDLPLVKSSLVFHNNL
jgi:hypothetical protein